MSGGASHLRKDRHQPHATIRPGDISSAARCVKATTVVAFWQQEWSSRGWLPVCPCNTSRVFRPGNRARCLRPRCTFRWNMSKYRAAVKRIENNPAGIAGRGSQAGPPLGGGVWQVVLTARLGQHNLPPFPRRSQCACSGGCRFWWRGRARMCGGSERARCRTPRIPAPRRSASFLLKSEG